MGQQAFTVSVMLNFYFTSCLIISEKPIAFKMISYQLIAENSCNYALEKEKKNKEELRINNLFGHQH